MTLLPTLTTVLALALTTTVSATELPNFKSLPHWRGHNQCLAFSDECLAALHAQGIPATQVYYKWQQAGPHGEESGFHATVIFQHAGAFWFMDNTRFAPKKISAKTDHGAMMEGLSKNTFLTLVDRRGSKLPTRHLDERFRKAGL